ncbi:hypothetical protein LBMAG56_45600 [Verrucomicrobiota bacterium]|nr:hypothetical protein LBMAG56_45600 [Verrucomicrobiota bacterium]
MGLAETQRLLAHLYTDPRVREQFFTHPATVAAEFSLPPADLHVLRHLPRAEINRFARSLQNKRLGDTAKLLPLTRRALGRHFAPRFLAWAESTAPATSHHHTDDARHFAAHLLSENKKTAAPAKALAPWITNLLRYETAALTAATPGRHCIFLPLRFTPADLQKCARSSRHRSRLRPRPSLAVWFRLTPHGRLRHLHLSLPFF